MQLHVNRLTRWRRKIEANIAILISDVLPDGMHKFGFYENIWVTSYEYALPLVDVLRMSLFELAVAKSTSSNKDEKLEALFAYLTKDSFRNRFEAQVENIVMLRNDLDTEQRTTMRIWKKRFLR